MRLLAIDPGTYACGLYDGKLRICREFGKKDPLPKRLQEFMSALNVILANGRYDTVAFERNFLRGKKTVEALCGQCGIIMALAEQHDCAVLPIEISSWKKWARLKPGTKASDDKRPTIALAEQFSGIGGLSEHEADAIVIWNYVMATAQESN